MRRIVQISAVTLCCCLSFFALQAACDTVKTKWSKVFVKPVSWYARTSAGIILVKAGKSLYALEEADGEQLWMQPVVETTGKLKGSMDAAALRAQDVLEVPGMGVLLLNHAKLQGDKDGRLIALNLANGKRLWDQPETDELMTAVPLYESGDAVLVSRRRQKKIFIAEEAAILSTGIPFSAYFSPPYPYRFELSRIDLATGHAKWSTEYERTFTPGTTRVQRLGDHFFIYFGNRVMTAIGLGDGKFLWEDGAKRIGNTQLALPVATVDGKLIYNSEYVRAVDPATQKEIWSIEDLGKVGGIVVRDGLAVALGDKQLAAVEIATGKQLWRNETHGHTSNLVWDKASDGLVYLDGKGLHKVEAATGKEIQSAPVRTESWPSHIRLASSEIVVTIALKQVCAYNLKTQKKLFLEGKLDAFFRANTALDNWPMPESGQELIPMSRPPGDPAEWEHLRNGTLLNEGMLKTFEDVIGAKEEFLEAYETENETGARKVWWIDPSTEQKVEITPSGDLYEVDPRLRMVFAVNKFQLWGGSVEQADKTASAGKPGN